jgi:Co/Zn/Cd efflux system component
MADLSDLSGNNRSLLVMFILFSLITTTQYVAAIVAHSLALKADCVSMAVDAVSYLFNMVAECQENRSWRAVLELVMSAVSLSLLGYFTGFFFLEAAHMAGLLPTAGEEEEEDVDARIVLTFAALGIAFDVISLLSYKVWHLDGASTTTNVNMLSALLHVLSDLARSTTTFVEGLILLRAPSVHSGAIDGWSALIVCTLISFGVLGGVGKWMSELGACLRGGPSAKVLV